MKLWGQKKQKIVIQAQKDTNTKAPISIKNEKSSENYLMKGYIDKFVFGCEIHIHSIHFQFYGKGELAAIVED